MNILILSAGTRNKIVQYFKKAVGLNGKIVVTDMSELAPAVYEGDVFYKVPSIADENYIDIILNICKKEKINGVVSLIDPELSLLAKNKEKFNSVGTVVVGSDYELCEMALNKMKMFEWLSAHNYKCAKSYVDKNEFYKDVEKGKINYPVFVKPICGSASISISKVYDRETIELLFKQNDNLIIQEFLDGQEIGVDVYIDIINKNVISIFAKKKIVMRAGETDKSVSFRDEKLLFLIEKFVKECGWLGEIDIDVFEINGEYFISEVNPRFGGGYPHAYECGCNHMNYIVNNLKGKENISSIGNYKENIFMLKYNEVCIKDLNIK